MEGKTELKPCPFCGEENDFVITFSKSILPMHKDGTYYTVRIKCRNCWSGHHGLDSYSETAAYKSAVERWNRRATDGK